MKITKTANNGKLKLSLTKEEWDSIGKTAGWDNEYLSISPVAVFLKDFVQIIEKDPKYKSYANRIHETIRGINHLQETVNNCRKQGSNGKTQGI